MENKLDDFLKDKVILVPGGTGTIGSEIVRMLIKYPVKQIRVFSRDEHKQFILRNEFAGLPAGKVTFLIGDIRDRERVYLATEGVNLIFNAAAMKHVPLCEYNPFEAVKTNVLGTQNLVDAARALNVGKFVHISTDKAAMPINVMGATKLLAEKIAVSAEHYKGSHKTIFSAVRFGNVFGSRGSVVPLFHKQIKNGGPVSLTDKAMTRFMMQLSQAVDLVLKACFLSRGEELFILKMPVMRIYDLAKAMIQLLAFRYGHDPSNIKIDIVGKREGEKIYELLMSEEEVENASENEEMFCVSKKPPAGFNQFGSIRNRSDEIKPMEYNEILNFAQDYFNIGQQHGYGNLEDSLKVL